MIGIPVTDIILAYQREASAVLRTTRGDMWGILRHTLAELHARDIIDADDHKSLAASFAEALDVLARKKSASQVLESARGRYLGMLASRTSSPVARTLAELCHSAIASASAPSESGHHDVPTTLAATVSGKGAQALLWAGLGAVIGGAIGGGGGALLGAAIGAAVGACGDSDTTVTPTNNGTGGSPE